MASAREGPTAILLRYYSCQGQLSLHALPRTVSFARVKAYHKAWAFQIHLKCRCLDIVPSTVRGLIERDQIVSQVVNVANLLCMDKKDV